MLQYPGSAETRPFEFGFHTLINIFPDPVTGEYVTYQQRIQEIISAATIADDMGFDLVIVEERHTDDYVAPAPVVLLAAIAKATSRVRISTAIAVLGISDPRRFFEEFIILDTISGGRAEIQVGQVSAPGSLASYWSDIKVDEVSLAEKLKVFLRLKTLDPGGPGGSFSSSLYETDIGGAARVLPFWIGDCGSPGTAAVAGRLGLNLNISIATGKLERFRKQVAMYKQMAAQAGHDLQSLKIAVTSYCYVAAESILARNEVYATLAHSISNLPLKLKGNFYTTSRIEFEQMVATDMSITIGSPQEVIDKILSQYEQFGHHRCILQMDMNGMPFEKVVKSIEIIGKEVIPVVRQEIRVRRER
ncbi:MAG: LLM class flavin-dependent oxidoreductase [Chitinophagaceae bacterium]